MVQNQWAKKTVEIKEDVGEEQEDLLIIKIHKGMCPINIMTTYGKQEGHKEEIMQQIAVWDQRIVDIQRRGEHLMWIGDLNVKVGNDNEGVQGNAAEISPGGKLLRKMIKKRNLQLINGTD